VAFSVKESTPPPSPTRSERSAAGDSPFRLASPVHKRNFRLPLAAMTSLQLLRKTRNGRDELFLFFWGLEIVKYILKTRISAGLKFTVRTAP
jgi:hypothetical protein